MEEKKLSQEKEEQVKKPYERLEISVEKDDTPQQAEGRKIYRGECSLSDNI